MNFSGLKMKNCQLSDRIEALSHLSREWARIFSQEAERMIAQDLFVFIR